MIRYETVEVQVGSFIKSGEPDGFKYRRISSTRRHLDFQIIRGQYPTTWFTTRGDGFAKGTNGAKGGVLGYRSKIWETIERDDGDLTLLRCCSLPSH